MNERVRRARILTIVALAGLVVGSALFIHARLAEAPEARGPAASPVGVEHATVASPGTTRPTARTATNVATPEPVIAAPEEPRKPLDPSDYVRNGSKEPLVPRELHVDVEVSTTRGVLTAEPLVPRVLEVNAEVGARDAVTTEPLTPRVLELPPGTDEP
ncbi:hypothetical protein [Polyangium mundeleinium]|uniref:DUF2382 domain-containing protein n=1 Tax=Polyangium mundeleinium TaxID=2995306 RepID=A0ABT5EIR7_9BACT|nr:hypothetical protein [Polyangium mundeleinium]MDC0741703.1 hypothetical protein [Polyangium mundeleinium]